MWKREREREREREIKVIASRGGIAFHARFLIDVLSCLSLPRGIKRRELVLYPIPTQLFLPRGQLRSDASRIDFDKR